MLVAHGAIWLQLRASGEVAVRSRALAVRLSPVIAVLFAVAGVWVWLGIDGYPHRVAAPLDAMPNPLNKQVVVASGALLDIYTTMPIAMLAPVIGILGPLLTALLAKANRPGFAFVTSALGMAGIIGTAGLSMFPFVMPSSLDRTPA